MERVLQLFVFIPLVGFVLSLLIQRTREFTISAIAFVSVGTNLLFLTLFAIYWLLVGMPILNLKEITLYNSFEYQFMLDFFLDRITIVYLWLGSFLSFLVTLYSRYYMHRERGYKRFFNTILFFYLGYNITILSGNFETLFLGWEILGASSFLLISFYRERHLPVKNALKVYSIYRIGDLGIILVMWLSHHLWHENITFFKLQNYELVHAHLSEHSFVGATIALLILISAAAKSAMFPFSSWLPRAMEGPTPSSAIFYGSLSVHMGVFLLLRTYPFWEYQISIRWVIGILGLITTLISGMIARVQSSVKSQIAYASSAQLGLIFIELSAGLPGLALIHFAGNAFLRTYQLLVSPSVVSYHIKEQFYEFIPQRKTIEDLLPPKLQYSLYLMSLKEWNLDWFMFEYIWHPLKWMGRMIHKFKLSWILTLFSILMGGGVLFYDRQYLINGDVLRFLPEVIALFGLILVLRSFASRKSIYEAFGLLLMNNFLIALSISFNVKVELSHILLYLSGPIIAGIAGFAILGYLDWQEKDINLKQFYGHSYHYPVQAFLFLLCSLALSGFPITPSFVGEDLIYSHIETHQAVLAFIVSLSFIVDGLAIIRIYSRLFLGMPIKRFHEVGYRSS